jgi:membrane-bound inhibitor of C-type lysozyme
MIVRIALKAPNGSILNKTFFGVTALVDPQTHVLQIFNRNKVVVAQYPSGVYIWWTKTSTPQLRLSRAGRLLQPQLGT